MKIKTNILAHKLKEAFDLYADNDALSIGRTSYSYAALKAKAVSISHCIIETGIGKSPVAILGRKSFHTYAGICGALLASQSYMPLNLKFPASRNRKMLSLSRAKVIIADGSAIEMLDQLLTGLETTYHIVIQDNKGLSKKHPDHHFILPDDLPGQTYHEVTSSEDDVAYLLFTSGTTGTPKGVPVSNKNVTSYLEYVINAWEFREDDRFSQIFDLTFDLSVHDMMVCWLAGGCLCIPEDDAAFKMAAYIREQRINVWFSVPSMAILMDKMRLLKADSLQGIRLSFFCGEPLPVGIADKWREAAPGSKIVNMYGPSEATIAISGYEWQHKGDKSLNGIVSIGKMFSGQQHCLLDPEQNKKTDERGELCLGGSQVISGYLNDPELSRKYFVELPDDPLMMWYRTGDLVEMDDEGDLFFLGRTDSEVKISGFRVNLFEIDAMVRMITAAQQVATLLEEDPGTRLLAFVSNDGRMDASEIVSKCKEELPWYMIPEVIIFVEEMPLNPNGKIDRKQLMKMFHEQD